MAQLLLPVTARRIRSNVRYTSVSNCSALLLPPLLSQPAAPRDRIANRPTEAGGMDATAPGAAAAARGRATTAGCCC